MAATLVGHPQREKLYQDLEGGWPGSATATSGWSSPNGSLLAVMVMGCANHYSHHGSQIILLRRLQGRWDADADAGAGA